MRQLLVFGYKTFKITIPDDAKITFGPWSPPRKNKAGDWEFNRESTERGGTLRIYAGKSEKLGNLIACFSNVTSFRDLMLGYAEEVAREEGATIWKDDETGYVREEKVKREKDWVEPKVPRELTAGNGKVRRK